jgi:hypothetical protein
MSRQGQRHALRHLRKNIGLVRQEDHGGVVAGLGERSGEVVDAVEPPGTTHEGDLVTEAGEPKRAIALLDAHDVVLEDRDVNVAQRAGGDDRPLALPLRRRVIPPVVIAENGEDAERRPQPRQDGGDLGHPDATGHEPMSGDVISE